MKTVLKGIFNASILSLLLSLIYCCDDDDEGKGMAGFRKFKGEVVVSPSFTQIGDTVTFDIYRSFDWIHEVNGKIPVLTVSYYLDGVKVAEATSEDEKPYAVQYVVTDDLELRTYEVTAHCVSNWENYEIREEITPAKLTITK